MNKNNNQNKNIRSVCSICGRSEDNCGEIYKSPFGVNVCSDCLAKAQVDDSTKKVWRSPDFNSFGSISEVPVSLVELKKVIDATKSIVLDRAA